MKIQFIIHADFELPGAIVTWAKNQGFKTEIVAPFKGEALPSPSDFDWLVVMGGPQNASDSVEEPYLQKEIQLIRETIAKNQLVLGFCLGAQLIGEAFYAKTERSPNKEVGVFPIQLTESGKEDPILMGLPDTFDVVHWHSDMPGLTKECQILATSVGCPRQIVRYHPKAYGFQCHLEPTLNDIRNMITHCESDLRNGSFIQTKETLLQNDYKAINEKMFTLLDNLLMIDRFDYLKTKSIKIGEVTKTR